MRITSLKNVDGAAAPGAILDDNTDLLDEIISGTLFVTTNKFSNVSLTAGTLVSLIDSHVGVLTIPAGALVAGSLIRIYAIGEIRATGGTAHAGAVWAYLGATALSSSFISKGPFLTRYRFDGFLVVRTSGASGTLHASGEFSYDSGERVSWYESAAVSIDTTAALTLDVKGGFTSSDGSDLRITSEVVMAELFRSPLIS